MPLHESLGVVGVGFQVRDPRHLAEGERVAANGVVVGQFERGIVSRRRLARAEPVGHATERSQVGHAAALGKAAGHIEHRPFAHAEDHKVGL